METVIVGKYGQYAYDYNQYLWMKKAHGLFLRAMVDRNRWCRWARKHPKNRYAVEPKCFMDGSVRDSYYTRCSSAGKGFDVIPIIGWFWYDDVLLTYRMTRYPINQWNSRSIRYFDPDRRSPASGILGNQKFIDLIAAIEEFYNS